MKPMKWPALLAFTALLALACAPLAHGEGKTGEALSKRQMETAADAQAISPSPQTAPSAGPTSDEEETVYALGDRILMGNMKGDDVAALQIRLAELHYSSGAIDGKFGRLTVRAVRAFQRASGLEKIDGKAGPETLAALFSADAIAAPSPTPSPTPTPTPTPEPTPTPVPTPVATRTPDVAAAPFEMETLEATVAGTRAKLMIARDDAGEALYPLCGVMARLGYEYIYDAGNWQLSRELDGSELALLTDGKDGLCAGAMGSANGVLFLADEARRVWVFGEEAYVSAATLEAFGARVSESARGTVIEEIAK